MIVLSQFFSNTFRQPSVANLLRSENIPEVLQEAGLERRDSGPPGDQAERGRGRGRNIPASSHQTSHHDGVHRIGQRGTSLKNKNVTASTFPPKSDLHFD